MDIYISSVTLSGVALDGENPLPYFSDPAQDRPLTHDGTFLTEDECLFGFQTGKRVLPYAMQDRYTRDRRPRTIKTIVLENENLKAVFLPEYGARLYSLFDKRRGREILYKNEMLQFGNLSQRNAWFSGGIEFNFGHSGHSALTCSSLFAAEVQGPEHSFLRFYEYERTTGAFYQLDFHLPDKAETLDMYVRLQAAEGRQVPTYWWTNTAVRQTARCRVFSGTDRVLFNLPRPPGSPDSVPCFAAGSMPKLRIFDGDCSYPAQMDLSCEYFFQNSEACEPWEAVGYEDGRLFFEASTQPLRYRKMFCWGTHAGGRRWQSFLNAPEDTSYIEVQAGIAPTQLHGAFLLANEAIEFTQSFGECDLPEGCLELEWSKAAKIAEDAVRKQLPHKDLLERHGCYGEWADISVKQLYHAGSGWGALESARLAKKGLKAPLGIYFPGFTLNAGQLPWLELLEKGILPEHDPREPALWMTGEGWSLLLEASLLLPGGRHWESLLHLGVMYMENFEAEKARKAWEESIELTPSAYAWRNLSRLYIRDDKLKEAINCMEQAIALPGVRDPAFAEEYLSLLMSDGQYQCAWDFFNGMEPERCSDRAGIIMCRAALELNKDDYLEKFFNTEHAVIQEGEDVLTNIWFAWQARLRGESETDTRHRVKMPEKIDFRMST